LVELLDVPVEDVAWQSPASGSRVGVSPVKDARGSMHNVLLSEHRSIGQQEDMLGVRRVEHRRIERAQNLTVIPCA
jgi:hypothetical protein